jgi:cytoskeleton protein RodZ
VPFGRELQLEREQLGVPLEAVADGTKVSLRFLRALEAGDIASLPGGVFQRGIVRNYCKFLGLNEQEWLTRFATNQEIPNTEIDWTEFAENVKRTRVRTNSSMRPRWWGVLLMLVLLVGLVFVAWHFVIGPKMKIH